MGRAHVRYTRRVVSLNLIAIHLQEEMCEQKLFLGSPQSHLRVSHKGEGELGKEKSARASASLSLIHISEPTRLIIRSRMPSSA